MQGLGQRYIKLVAGLVAMAYAQTAIAVQRDNLDFITARQQTVNWTEVSSGMASMTTYHHSMTFAISHLWWQDDRQPEDQAGPQLVLANKVSLFAESHPLYTGPEQ